MKHSHKLRANLKEHQTDFIKMQFEILKDKINYCHSRLEHLEEYILGDEE